jgi:hypothetical protein
MLSRTAIRRHPRGESKVWPGGDLLKAPPQRLPNCCAVQREHIVKSLLAHARRWREEADKLAADRHQAETRRRAAAYAEESAARIARAA